MEERGQKPQDNVVCWWIYFWFCHLLKDGTHRNL